jgi:hypothetical protein
VIRPIDDVPLSIALQGAWRGNSASDHKGIYARSVLLRYGEEQHGQAVRTRMARQLLPRAVGVFSLTPGRCAARPGTASADLEHQLAPQVARFAYPVGLGCVGECVASNVRWPYCTDVQQCQHPFQMFAVTGHARS